MNLVLGVTINLPVKSFSLSKHHNTATNTYAKHLYALKNVFKTTTTLGEFSCLKQSSKHDECRPAAQWNREAACVECIARAQCARINEHINTLNVTTFTISEHVQSEGIAHSREFNFGFQ